MRTVLLSLCSAALCSAASAAELVVPTQFATIQAAIIAASPGDSIRVLSGTYSGQIDFLGKALTVWAPSGPSATILDGNGVGPVVRFASNEGPASVLYGFAVTNGSAIFEGGGVLIQSSSPTLNNLHIYNNQASSGGGLAILGGQPEIISCAIFENRCFLGGSGDGANIYVATTEKVTIRDCSIFGSPSQSSGAQRGGGVFVGGSPAGRVTIKRCRFSQNSATSRGGAICVLGAELVLANSDFSFNRTAGNGGALHVGTSSQGTNATVSNCLFRANQATGGASRGGAIAAEASGLCSVRSSTFSANQAGFIGGNAYCGLGTLAIDSSILFDGIATQGRQLALQLAAGGTASASVAWSDVQGGQAGVHVGSSTTLTWGAGNIDANPLYFDAFEGRLHANSPCIDAGDPNYVAGPIEREFPGSSGIVNGYPGELRQNGRLDMGCDEYWDCTGNNVPDHGDVFADCNANRLPDACEIASSLVLDLDSDGIPDNCEVLGNVLCTTPAPLAPCGNYDSAAGAVNSRTDRGAEINAVGSLSLAADDLRLIATGLNPSVLALLFSGTSVGQSFAHNGLVCASGSIRRLGQVLGSPTGTVSFGPGLALAAGWLVGDTRVLQMWYRDAAGRCGTSNYTNALQVTFLP